jgi:glycerophosphoryl diester phosphodiesterase
VRRPKIGRLGAGVGLALLMIMMVLWARLIMVRGGGSAKPPGPLISPQHAFFAGLPQVLNIAHRGASKSAPEHSLEAYALALRQGAHVLELDLRATRDQVLLIAHDRDLKRTLGLPLTLAELSWAEIVSGAGERAPLRLDDVLTRFPSVRFNLELKDKSLEGARGLARLIASHGAEARVLVASAHRATLDEFRRAAQEQALQAGAARVAVATSASTPEVLAFYLCYLIGSSCADGARAYVALQLPVSGWLGLTRPEFIEHAHARGLVVHFWTVDDASVMLELISAGADGIMTNRPESLARLLGAPSE